MGEVLSYYNELKEAMALLASHPKSIFVGQGVGCAGTSMTDTLADVPKEKLFEFPVAEDMQLGFCIGLAIDGMLPISIFPRWNFLICATNQLVNHLDKLVTYSNGGYNPKVIIRVAAPLIEPFNSGPQHSDDFTDCFRRMLKNVEVVDLVYERTVLYQYKRAMKVSHSVLLVEHTAMYGNVKPSGVKS